MQIKLNYNAPKYETAKMFESKAEFLSWVKRTLRDDYKMVTANIVVWM